MKSINQTTTTQLQIAELINDIVGEEIFHNNDLHVIIRTLVFVLEAG